MAREYGRNRTRYREKGIVGSTVMLEYLWFVVQEVDIIEDLHRGPARAGESFLVLHRDAVHNREKGGQVVSHLVNGEAH